MEGKSGHEDDAWDKHLAALSARLSGLDLQSLARARGCTLRGDTIAVRSLGKEFLVDARGTIRSECHLIPWVQIPLLAYLTHATHEQPSGRWLSFREIPEGNDWLGLFCSRCETPLRQLTDVNPAFFNDLIDLFQGRKTAWYEADIALILHPLPHVPILLCYQTVENDLDSKCSVFFDACCAANLPSRALYSLCAGLTRMFVTISQRHL